MNRFSSCLIAILLMCLWAAAVSADQDILVTKKVDGIPRNPDMAIDASTGHVLIVFELWNALTPAKQEIYATFLKRKSNGDYRRRKTVLLSSANGWNANPSVIYVPQAGHFLTAWDTRNPGTNTASSILARIAKRKNGKPQGGIITLVNNGEINFQPELFSFLDPLPAAPAAGDHIRIVGLGWGKNHIDPAQHVGPDNTLPEAGFRWQFNVPNGKSYTTDHEMGLIPGVIFHTSEGYRQRVFYPYGGKVAHDPGITYIEGNNQLQNGNTTSFQPAVFAYDNNWNPAGSTFFNVGSAPASIDCYDNDGDPSLYTVSANLSIGIKLKYYDFDFELKGENTIDVKDKDFFDADFISPPQFGRINFAPQPSARAIAGYIIGPATDGTMYAIRYFASNKPQKKPQALFRHNNRIFEFKTMGVGKIDDSGNLVDEGSNVMIVWRDFSQPEHELRAFIKRLKF